MVESRSNGVKLGSKSTKAPVLTDSVSEPSAPAGIAAKDIFQTISKYYPEKKAPYNVGVLIEKLMKELSYPDLKEPLINCSVGDFGKIFVRAKFGGQI